MHSTVHKALDVYIDTPSKENFVRLQVAVAASPDYAPYSNYSIGLQPLVEREDYERAMEFLVAQMPTCVLNPGIHRALSQIQHKRGDKEAAKSEYTLAMLVMEGLLSTGDGSENKAYVVLHMDDERDILEHLGKVTKEVSEILREENIYHAVRCADGTVVWFNITSLRTRQPPNGHP